MTDQLTNEPTNAAEGVMGPENASQAPQTPAPEPATEADRRIAALNAENKERREALAAEKARTGQLQTRLDQYDTEAAARIAGEVLHPDALQDFHALAGDISKFKDDDGQLDAEKVKEAAQALVSSRPYMARPQQRRRDSGAGVRQSVGVSTEPSFGQMLKDKVEGKTPGYGQR